MWRFAWILAALGGAPAASLGADFWQVKNPDAWTEKEAQSLRRNSPWAKQGVLETQKLRTVRETTGQGKSAKTTAKQQREWVRVADVQFRWESSAPLLATTARVDPRLHRALEQLAAEFYLVSVSGLPPATEGLDAMTEAIRQNSSIHFGDRSEQPRTVRAMDSGNGVFFVLQFPRDIGLEELARSLEVRVHVGGARAQASFEPKHMVFQGKPAL